MFSGKSSALHLLVHVGHETLEETNSSALAIVLKHHPNMEHRNLDGKTALVLAVETKEDKALTLMVRVFIYEPRRDKTNKMSVRPAKTQISLGIHPV